MDHFSKVLAQRLKKHKISKEAYASLVLEKTKQIISAHFDENIEGNIIPYKYIDKKVYITAKNSVWKHLIFPYKKVFCTLLQKEFPKEKIKEIIVL